MSTYRLDKLFAPRSVALVGASPREGSLGRMVLRNLREAGFPGPLQLVNPKHREIDGLPCVPRLEDLRGGARPRSSSRRRPPPCPASSRAPAAKGVAAAVIVTAGLGHGEGSLAEAARLEARRHGLRLVGPNCLGVMAPPAKLNASFAARSAGPGDLALISQSGAVAAGLDRMGGAAQRRLLGGLSRSATRSTSISATGSTTSRPTAARARSCSTSRRSATRASSCRRRAPLRARSRSWSSSRAGTRRARGRRHPYRRACGLGRRLRRRIPPRRAPARVRPRRALRRGRDARPAEALPGQAARDPHQRRRRRRARGRPADRSRRHARGALARDASRSSIALLPPTWSRANPVDIDRRRRCGPLRARRSRRFSPTPRTTPSWCSTCRPRSPRAREAAQAVVETVRADRAEGVPPQARLRGLARRGRGLEARLREHRHPAFRDRGRRGARLHAARALPRGAGAA